MKHLIEQIAEHEPQSFFAPVLTKDTTQVLTIQDEIPYRFNIRVQQSGWYEINPNGNIERDMLPVEILQYLNQLKRIFVIALFPFNEGWIVSPFNRSDAKQRGWQYDELKQLYICNQNLTALDIVQARIIGSSLLYEQSAFHQDVTPDIEYAQNLVAIHAEKIRREEFERARLEQTKTTEGKIQEALDHAGAKLIEWQQTSNGYQVIWEHNGNRNRTSIDENLRVTSAGICLADTDNWHSLHSIVSVMEDARSGREFGGYV